jgi:hypothetical protein
MRSLFSASARWYPVAALIAANLVLGGLTVRNAIAETADGALLCTPNCHCAAPGVCQTGNIGNACVRDTGCP